MLEKSKILVFWLGRESNSHNIWFKEGGMDYLLRTVWPSYTSIQRHPSAILTSRSRPIGNQPSPTPPNFYPSDFVYVWLPKLNSTFRKLSISTVPLTPLSISDVYACDSWTQQAAGTDSSISRHKPTPPGYKYTPASNSPLRIQIPNRANFCRSKFQIVLTSRASHNPIPPAAPLGIQTPALCPLKPDRIWPPSQAVTGSRRSWPW